MVQTPSRFGYVLSALLLAASIGCLVLFIISIVGAAKQSAALKHGEIGTTFTVHVRKVGRQHIFVETRSANSIAQNELLQQAILIEVTSPAGTKLKLTPASGNFTYTLGRWNGLRVASFPTQTRGGYRVTTRLDDSIDGIYRPTAGVAVGHLSLGGLARSFLWLGGSIIAGLAGLVALILTAIKRTSAHRRNAAIARGEFVS